MMDTTSTQAFLLQGSYWCNDNLGRIFTNTTHFLNVPNLLDIKVNIDCNDTVTTADNLNHQPESISRHVSLLAVGMLSTLFFIIAIVGILGNTIVIYVILSDSKMRHSVTDLFILNLAFADLAIMLFGVPEIVQFILDRGWLLGTFMCKLDRYVLVTSLYSSITTLMAVCIER